MDLNSLAPIIEKILKDSLTEKRYPFGMGKYRGIGNKVATGNLVNSVKVVVKKENNFSVLQVIALDYIKWVQSGRLPGKRGIPVDSIEKWIKARGLQGRDKKGKYIKRRSFAFAIQNNIKKFGIKPSNVLDVALDKVATDQRVIEIIGNEAFEELVNLIEGI